ncbi:helix-turn-helix transcriptional regulator [Demequina sp.]|uniref:helix-turn-helix transcriptional regulator n=1 Tax=Demequina sp. TaxID=2050685 RepID=UPI003A848E09
MSPDGERIGHALRTAASQHSMAADSGALTTRRSVVQGLRSAGEPVTVTELAARLDLHSNTVRNHLESLADDGLVIRTRVRTGGRGRPSTQYAPIPGRLFPLDELATELKVALTQAEADAIAKSAAESWTPGSTYARPADDLDQAVDNAVAALQDVGFDVSRNRIGDEITMTGCPYAELITDNPQICAIHAELVHSVLESSEQPVRLSGVDVWVRPGVCRARLTRPDVQPVFSIPSSPTTPNSPATL